MSCKSCEERRQMMREAYQKGGIKGAVKAAPAVAKHFMRQKPVIIKDRKP